MNQLAKLLIFVYVVFFLTNETEQHNGLTNEVRVIFILPYKGPGGILNSKNSPYVLIKSQINLQNTIKNKKVYPLYSLVWAIFKP